MLIFGGVTQAVYFFMPESRATILLDREAKRRRKTGEDPNIYGPNELKSPRISLKEAGKVWLRPFEMFLREPIVLCLSLLSGFSDALIFTFLESYSEVYTAWGFGILAQAWAVIPIVSTMHGRVPGVGLRILFEVVETPFRHFRSVCRTVGQIDTTNPYNA